MCANTCSRPTWPSKQCASLTMRVVIGLDLKTQIGYFSQFVSFPSLILQPTRCKLLFRRGQTLNRLLEPLLVDLIQEIQPHWKRQDFVRDLIPLILHH